MDEDAANGGPPKAAAAAVAARAPPSGTIKNLSENLILHASEGNSAEVKWLLTSERLRGEVLNTKILECSALTLAVKGGFISIVTSLIEAGASMYVLDNEHKTPLMIAAEKGHAEVIKILLTNKADKTMRLGIHRNNANGAANMKLWKLWKLWTALMFAVANDNYAAVELLLATSPERTINQLDSKNNTALLLACAKICNQEYDSTNVRMVELLLSKGADVNATNGEGHTCLQMAAKSNNTKLIATLLKSKGIDVDKITAHSQKEERSALYLACERFHYEAVRLLLKRTGDINAIRYFSQQIGQTDITSINILLTQQAFRDGSPYLPSAEYLTQVATEKAIGAAAAAASAAAASAAPAAPAAAPAATASAPTAAQKDALKKKVATLQKKFNAKSEELESTDPDDEDYDELLEEVGELETNLAAAKAAAAAAAAASGGRRTRTRKQRKQRKSYKR